MKQNIRCSICHKRYTVQRPQYGEWKTYVCPDCGHSFSYVEGS